MKSVAILVLALCAVACLGRSWESEYALNPPPAAAPVPPPAAAPQEAKPQEGPAQSAAPPAAAQQEGKEAVCTGDSCNPAPSPALQSLSKAFDQLKIPAAGDIPDQDFDKLLYCIGANYEQQHASKKQQQQQETGKANAKQQEAPKKQQEGAANKKKQQQEGGKKKKQQQEAKAPAAGAPPAAAAAGPPPPPPAQAPAFIGIDEPQPLAQNAPGKQEAPAAVPPPPPPPAAAAGKPQQEAPAPAPAQGGKQQQEAPKQAQQESAMKADAGGSGIALAHLRKLISTVCCLDSPDDANPKCTKDELVACVKVGIAKVLTKEAAGINYVKHNGNKKAVEVPSKAAEQMATPANAGAPAAAPAGGKKQQESPKKKQQQEAAKPPAAFLEIEDSAVPPPPPPAASAPVPPEKAQVLAKLGKQVAGTFKQGQALAHNDVQNAKAAPPAVQNFLLKEANSQKVEDDLHLFRKTLKAGIDCANIDFSKLNAKTYLFGPQKPKKQQQEAGKPAAAPQEAGPKKQQEAGKPAAAPQEAAPKKQQEAAPKKQQQEAPAQAAAPPAPAAAPAL